MLLVSGTGGVGVHGKVGYRKGVVQREGRVIGRQPRELSSKRGVLKKKKKVCHQFLTVGEKNGVVLKKEGGVKKRETKELQKKEDLLAERNASASEEKVREKEFRRGEPRRKLHLKNKEGQHPSQRGEMISKGVGTTKKKKFS